MDALLKIRNTFFLHIAENVTIMDYYKQQIKSFNETVPHTLKNEIDLILPQLPIKQK